MEVSSLSNVVSAGMGFERSRIESAMFKIAMANVDFSSTLEAQEFMKELSSRTAGARVQSVEAPDLNVVHSPGSPKADMDGNVYRLRVDPTHEMATLVSASRAYEANVRAFNVHVDITRSALGIGRGR